jgi:alkylation response protein AidB-like acyl-CoA dehydrogenase
MRTPSIGIHARRPRQVDSKRIDVDAKIPDDVMQGLKDLGLFGLQIPIEHGGLGLTNSAYARVAEEVQPAPSRPRCADALPHRL